MTRNIITGLLIVAGAALLVPAQGRARSTGTLYFFESAVCPACKRAKADMPAFKKKYPGLRVKSYLVRDGQNRTSAKNRQNIKLLVSLLKGIDRRVGGKPFIIETKKAYRLKVERGLPYYMKQISQYTTLKKEIPVPVFILGDRCYAGYRKHVLSRALRNYFK